MASKSRVAPIKKQTIPRLELLGTVLLARLVNKFTSTVKQLRTVNWTDSMTTLCWIKNERIWKQYVQHRVEEIRSLTSKDSWRHCPGELNPADIPSRGLNAKDLSVNSTWWNGPSFLLRPESEWPKPRPTQEGNELAQQEATKNTHEITHSMINTSSDRLAPNIEAIIDIKRFGNQTKLLRVTALVVKFIAKLKNRVRRKETRESTKELLTASELNDAETMWIKSVQANYFDKEIRFLTRKTRVP